MNISLKKFKSLDSDELQFLYCMMVSYGEMSEIDDSVPPPPPKNNKNRNNKNRNNNYKKKKTRPFKKRDKTKPDLYNFDDPLWEKCEDEKFLAYKELMEKVNR